MRQIISNLERFFFGEQVDLRVKIFNLLAVTGIVVCTLIVILFLALDVRMSNVVILNIVAVVFAAMILFYSGKNGRYQFCYLVTIIAVFFLLFPALFFSGGGYSSGMPCFFILAIVFTAYMLEGNKVWVVVSFEAVLYIGLCIYAYLFPGAIKPFNTEKDMLVDIVVGFVTVSFALGFTMYVQFQFYEHQQKQLKQARAEAEMANRAKSVFLANMSHEIRTPINIIMGTNELIQRDTSSEHIRLLSKRIHSSLSILQGILSNILDVSKIESGKVEPARELYSTKEMIASLEAVGAELNEKSEVLFHMKVSDGLPEYLIGDIVAIKKIAGNFLSNAFKYTKQGHVTLGVLFQIAEDPDEIILCIEVADTGIGIREEDVPYIFEAFNRADLERHRHIEGTGLGLAIVKELAELMGGTVFVESKYGKGSRFRAELPQELGVPNPRKAEGSGKRVLYAPEARILAVDDNEDNLIILREMLEPAQIRVDSVMSGAQCIEAVRKKEYHVILMDYMMPEMDGLEVLRKLKEQPDFNTPVVALTANAVAGTEQLLLAEGFAAYLPKPFTLSGLQDLLEQYIPEEFFLTAEPHPAADSAWNRELKQKLKEYGLNLDVALEYFEGDLFKLRQVAELLARSYENEKAELEKNGEAQNPALKFQIHSLRSKFRNVGLLRLSNTAMEIESLCSNRGFQEALTMLPHFFYLWQKGKDGLTFLISETETLTAEQTRPQAFIRETEQEEENLWESLDSALKNMNRKPALLFLEQLLEKEKDPEKSDRLKEITAAVLEFDFRRARKTEADLRGIPVNRIKEGGCV